MIELTKNIHIYETQEINGQIVNVLVSSESIDKTQDEINQEAMDYLQDTDWMVTRHSDELNAGVETTLSQTEYNELYLLRKEARALIQK